MKLLVKAIGTCLIQVMLGCLVVTSVMAEGRPGLVLFPIEVDAEDSRFEDDFGTALQQGLQTRYTVFYGSDVDKELEKEYSKIDCTPEQCIQNVAIAFNAELVGDASAKRLGNGYSIKMVVRNALTNEVVESVSVPCRNCDGFSVLDTFKDIGLGKHSIAAAAPSSANQTQVSQKATHSLSSDPSSDRDKPASANQASQSLASSKPVTLEDKASYGIGVNVATSMLDSGVNLNVQGYTSGITDKANGKKNKYPNEQPSQVLISEKSAYVVGYQMYGRLQDSFADINLGHFLQGFRHKYNDLPVLMTSEELQQVFTEIQKKIEANKQKDQERQLAANKQQADSFLKQNRNKPGVVETPSGLQYKVLRRGSGASPSETSKVTVHYEGRLIDGTKFDSSYDRNSTASFGVNQVILGWVEGLQLMNPGSKYQFYIPSHLAYGDKGTGSSIPPGSLLIFDVELFSFE